MRPAKSRFAGGLRVGADFFERRRAVRALEPAPRGVVDRMSDLANASIDVARIHPDVVAFFEDTSGLGLHVESRWRFPVRLVWWLARPVMRWIGQFVYPRDHGRITTTCFGIDRDADGRTDARGVVRSYADGSVMQVVAYATWNRYMSAAFPLPLGGVLGILRLDHGPDEGAVTLTSAKRDGDDAGVWLVVGGIGVPAPFGERIELYAPSMQNAPKDAPPADVPTPTIVGRHEQRLFGVRMVTHLYWMWPLSSGTSPAR